MDTVLKLRELRRLRGLSQRDVARISGVGEKTLSSFETGQRVGSLKVSQLSKILRVYEMSLEEFFGRALEEQLDPDVVRMRSREEDLVARLRALPELARTALLEKFELMLDATDAVRTPRRERQASATAFRPAA